MSLIFKGIYLGGGGGGSANLTTLDVTPMTNYQSISPEEGYDGFSLVNVSAVNSSIDPNITAGNIVNGVNILGVVGSYAPVVENLDVTPMTSAQSFVPNVGVTGFNMVNVSEVNSSIDPNITASNIVNGVDILGVVGTAEASGALARYKVENGVASVSDKNITGAFSDIESVEANAFNYAFTFTNITGEVNFCNCLSVGNEAFQYAFYNTNITGEVNFCNLENCNGFRHFQSSFTNASVSSLNFSGLNSINYSGAMSGSVYVNAFTGCCFNCKNLTNVSFNNLKTINSADCFHSAFTNSGLVEANFHELREVNQPGAFSRAFMYCYNLTSVDFSSLEYIGNGYLISSQFYRANNSFDLAFSGCNKLTETPFKNLLQVGPNTFYRAFYNCFNLLSANFSKLEQVADGFGIAESAFTQAFINCTNLQYANFCNLVCVANNCFSQCCSDCYNLSSINFESLSYIGSNAFYRAFYNCPKISEAYFNSLQNIMFGNCFTYAFGGVSNSINMFFPSMTIASDSCFTNMLSGRADSVVHFPSNWENKMNSWSSVLAGFGGTNTTILFDYPSIGLVSSLLPLADNGTIGVSPLAVNASSESADAWQALDNSVATGWHSAVSESPHSFSLYCKGYMNITDIMCNTPLGNNSPKMINVCVSNDGETWNEINATWSYFNRATYNRVSINISNPSSYKYYRLYFNSPYDDPSYLVTINEMTITGVARNF